MTELYSFVRLFLNSSIFCFAFLQLKRRPDTINFCIITNLVLIILFYFFSSAEQLKSVVEPDDRIRPLEDFQRLRNGQMQKIRDTHTLLFGACMLNSYLHIMAVILKDNLIFLAQLFKVIMNSPVPELLRILAVLLEQGGTGPLYRWLLDYLTKSGICPPYPKLTNVNAFSCQGPFEKTFEKIVSPIFPTMTSSQNCKCNNSKKKYPFLPVDSTHIKANSVKDLQNAILHKDFGDIRVVCEECHEECLRAFDISSLLTIFLRHSDIDMDCDDIPKVVYVKKRRYTLKCILDVNSTVHHALTKCLRGGIWYQYDDMTDEVITPTKCTPYVLFYERNDEVIFF